LNFEIRYTTLTHCSPSDFAVSVDAKIEARTVETSGLAVRRSYHSARSYPQSNAVIRLITVKRSQKLESYGRGRRLA
jgi:hypothetical protein